MHPAGVVIEVEAGAGGVGEAQASMPAEARMPVEAPSSAAASTAGATDFVQLHASEQEKEFNNTVDAKTVSPSLEPLAGTPLPRRGRLTTRDLGDGSDVAFDGGARGGPRGVLRAGRRGGRRRRTTRGRQEQRGKRSRGLQSGRGHANLHRRCSRREAATHAKSHDSRHYHHHHHPCTPSLPLTCRAAVAVAQQPSTSQSRLGANDRSWDTAAAWCGGREPRGCQSELSRLCRHPRPTRPLLYEVGKFVCLAG